MDADLVFFSSLPPPPPNILYVCILCTTTSTVKPENLENPHKPWLKKHLTLNAPVKASNTMSQTNADLTWLFCGYIYRHKTHIWLTDSFSLARPTLAFWLVSSRNFWAVINHLQCPKPSPFMLWTTAHTVKVFSVCLHHANVWLLFYFFSFKK